MSAPATDMSVSSTPTTTTTTSTTPTSTTPSSTTTTSTSNEAHPFVPTVLFEPFRIHSVEDGYVDVRRSMQNYCQGGI
jgi:hypothetical protein